MGCFHFASLNQRSEPKLLVLVAIAVIAFLPSKMGWIGEVITWWPAFAGHDRRGARNFAA
jgi:hypothetical protein